MVAQLSLDQLVGVRVPVPQFFYALEFAALREPALSGYIETI